MSKNTPAAAGTTTDTTDSAATTTTAAPPAPAAKVTKVKARVLVEGVFGKVNDVVEVAKEEVEASDQLDATPAAVKYAESLKPAEPEAE